MPPRTRLTALLLTAVAGCGNTSLPSTPPILKPSDFWNQMSEWDGCELSARCGSITASEVPTCRAQFAALLAEPDNGFFLDEEVASGKTAFDAAAANRCMSFIRTLDCTTFFAPTLYDMGCWGSALYAGRVPLGGACDDDAECIDGSCYDANAADFCTVGKCAAYIAPGGSCAGSGECDPTSYCEVNSLVCTPLIPAGDACGPRDVCGGAALCQDCVCTTYTVPVGGACGGGNNCVANVYCIGGRCVNPGTHGHACDGSGSLPPCAIGFACVGENDDTAAVGKCSPWLDVGDHCDLALQQAGAVTGCPMSATCDAATSTCQLNPPTGVAGDPCDANTLCDGDYVNDLYCNPAIGKCAPSIAAGGACDPTLDADVSSNQCLGASTCDPTSRTCVAVCTY